MLHVSFMRKKFETSFRGCRKKYRGKFQTWSRCHVGNSRHYSVVYVRTPLNSESVRPSALVMCFGLPCKKIEMFGYYKDKNNSVKVGRVEYTKVELKICIGYLLIAGWVLWFFTMEQEQRREDFLVEFFSMLYHSWEKSLSRFDTINEMWVPHFRHETKEQLKQ